MTISATSRIPTTHGSRYLQQLCKHWAHKFAVTFDTEKGTVPFSNGAVVHFTAEPEHLLVLLDAPDTETLDRMKSVVIEHLDRFAFREAPLAANWSA